MAKAPDNKSKLRIEADGYPGNWKVWVDDVPLTGVQDIQIELNAINGATAIITYKGEVELMGDVALLIQRQTRLLRCQRPHSEGMGQSTIAEDYAALRGTSEQHEAAAVAHQCRECPEPEDAI